MSLQSWIVDISQVLSQTHLSGDESSVWKADPLGLVFQQFRRDVGWGSKFHSDSRLRGMIKEAIENDLDGNWVSHN